MIMTNEYIRELIRSLKEKKGISWEEIAEKADVSKDTLYKFIYNQTGSMKFHTIAKVLDALGMEMAVRPKEDK